MKKLISGILCIALALSIVSCSTTAKKQAKLNAAFADVYEKYAGILDMDGATTYTVKKGDTMTDITKKLYGKNYGYYFPVIMLASSKVVLDPDTILPGTKLVVPDLQKNLKNTAIRAKLKTYFNDVAYIYYDKTTREATKTRRELQAISESL